MLTTLTFRYAAYLFVIVYCGNPVISVGHGEPCSLDDGTAGTCKFITACQSALDLLNTGFLQTGNCDVKGIQQVVCCTVEDTTTTTTTTTARSITTRTTTTTEKPDYGTADRKPGEISKKQCVKYAKYVIDMRPATILFAVRRISNTSECGFNHLKLIVGGTRAEELEFPHMALIGYKTGEEVDWACGGSLISDTFVLTAAHCLKDTQRGPARFVRVGITNQSVITNMQERMVSETFAHHDYHDNYHDIGLIKLSVIVDLNIYARPACLYTEKSIFKDKAIASGWGKTGYYEDGSNDLLKVVLELFTAGKCNNTYKRDIVASNSNIKEGIIDDWMICAGSSQTKNDTCKGDSGGPLQIYHNEKEVKCMYDIIGVTSFGRNCGLTVDIPGVYTRVSNYIKWIEDIVWPY